MRLDLAERLRAIEREKEAIEDPYPPIVLRAGIEFNEWFAGWCERMESELLAPASKKGSS